MSDMRDLPFQVELEWSGSGREGAGRIVTDDLELELSAPSAMGGRGVGTNPEELLVSAVAACYSATLFGVLRRAGLPATSLTVSARGSVSGYPEDARFAQIVVSPTIVGGDAERVDEYERAAADAHERCFIGRTLAESVDYQVGWVAVAPAEAAERVGARPEPQLAFVGRS